MAQLITSKGELTLPAQVIETLKLKPGDAVDFLIHEDGKVELVTKKLELDDFVGCLPRPLKPVSLDTMEEAIIEGASQ